MSASSQRLGDRIDFVHITLGKLKRQTGDPFGRAWIGYETGRSSEELWEPNRGYWRLDPERVDRCQLAIFSHAGVVVMVAEITGLEPSIATSGKYVGRFALEGRPVEAHPLIGGPQPVPRSTGNPIAYGSL